MRMSLRVKSVDTSGLSVKLARARTRALTLTTLAAIEDTRPYVPRLSGDLAGTADSGSKPASGLIVYGSSAVPYARRQYYDFPRKTTTFHPQATTMWFEYSKAANRLKWERTFGQEYKGVL